MVLAAPLPASAATVAQYSSEVGPNGIATRAAANALATPWVNAVTAAGGVPTGKITFNTPSYVLGSAIAGTVFTTTDGVTLGVARTRYLNTNPPVYDGPSPIGNAGEARCWDLGTSMQGDSPRPSSLVDSNTPNVANCTSTTPGVGGFIYDQINGTGEDDTRDAVEFNFGKPVLAFGAWFGDLETRTDGGGTPAWVRLYDSAGQELSSQKIEPSIANQSLCGASTFTGCGNRTTRWIGFVADPTQLVARMVVIVGDNGPGDGLKEGLGFSGPMMATAPAISTTKTVAPGYPVNLGNGQYEVRYELSATNTGVSPLSGVGLVDDLAATFSPIALAAISVQSVTLTGATVVANTGYDGTSDPQLLLPASSTLAAGASFTAAIVVRVTPGANLGAFANSSTASGTSGTTTVSDSPDTAASVTFTEAPAITATKTVTSTTSLGDGTQSVEFSIDVRNSGDVALSSLVVDDSLTGAFGAQFVSTSVPTATVPLPGSSVIVNPNFNGDSDPHAVTTASVLASGHTVTITFTAVIRATSAAPGANAVAASGVSPGGQSVEANSSADVSLPFTGSLRIDKVIDGPALTQDSTFSFEVDCGAASFTPSVLVLAGQTTGTTTVTGISALSSCDLVEGPLPPAPAGYLWSNTALAGSPASIVDGATSTVTVTNSLRLRPATLVITKTIAGGPVSGGAMGIFEFLVDCGPGDVIAVSIQLQVNNASSSSAAVAVPAGRPCAVSGTTLPAAPAGYSWLPTSSIQPGVFTAPPDATVGVLVAASLIPRTAIASTGSDPSGVVLAMLGLLATGGILLLVGRRRVSHPARRR